MVLIRLLFLALLSLPAWALDDLTARMHLDSIEARRILSESPSTQRELA